MVGCVEMSPVDRIKRTPDGIPAGASSGISRRDLVAQQFQVRVFGLS
jgi:hypothetical protein